MKTMTLTALATVTLLGACGGSGSNPFHIPESAGDRGDVTVNDDGSYTLVDNGETIELDASMIANSGVLTSGDEAANLSIISFANDDVTLISGFSEDAPFSSIIGTADDAPEGEATFSGSYIYSTTSGSNIGNVILEYDFVENDLETADGSEFEVDGEIAADGTIYGTVEYNEVETGFTGGFYGDATVGGVFDDGNASGMFYGTKQ